jgi:hypothetical protein
MTDLGAHSASACRVIVGREGPNPQRDESAQASTR